MVWDSGRTHPRPSAGTGDERDGSGGIIHWSGALCLDGRGAMDPDPGLVCGRTGRSWTRNGARYRDENWPLIVLAVGVKSATEYKGTYGPIATDSYTVDLPGPCSENLRRLPFENVTRSIFPFDELRMKEWEMQAAFLQAPRTSASFSS